MERASVESIVRALNGEGVRWVHEKGLTVFSLFSAAHLTTEIDLFVESPFPFDEAFAAAVRLDVGSGVTATFVGIENLLLMKRAAGRPQDVEDIAQLEAIWRPQSDD